MSSRTFSPVRSLANAVSAAFTRAALTEDEINVGIEHRDLTWTCPPLVTDAAVCGVRLDTHFDHYVRTDAAGLMQFWRDILEMMHLSPSRIIKDGVLVGTKLAMPGEKVGSRAFRFSTPQGYPDQLDSLAGITLSMEVANVAAIGLPIVNRVIDEDNFYVELRSGVCFGVKDGRPAIPSPWSDYSAAGMVEELARSSRGLSTTACMYDEIALARSLLHTYRKRWPAADFEGLDMAVQALRYLTRGTHCPGLVTAMRAVQESRLQLTEKETLLTGAVELMATPSLSDKAKLQTLIVDLVPRVLSRTAFRSNIFSGPVFPYSLAPEKLSRINTYLQAELASVKSKLGRVR